MQTKNLDKLYLSALRASAKKRMSSGGQRRARGQRTANITTSKRSNIIDLNGLEKLLRIPAWRKHRSGKMLKHHYSTVLDWAALFFEKFGLDIIPFPRGGGNGDLPYRFQIVPRTSWSDSARKVYRLLDDSLYSNTGHMEFGNLSAFLRAGPYTAREAVLTHVYRMSSDPNIWRAPA